MAADTGTLVRMIETNDTNACMNIVTGRRSSIQTLSTRNTGSREACKAKCRAGASRRTIAFPKQTGSATLLTRPLPRGRSQVWMADFDRAQMARI